jgi:hypothetical protein
MVTSSVTEIGYTGSGKFTFAVAADTSSGSLKLTGTGDANNFIYWNAVVDIVQVSAT